MFINDQNQVVLKKFSELENVNSFIETLVKTIYECFNFACFVCDDEKVLNVCGLSKKEFLAKKVNCNLAFKDEVQTNLGTILSECGSEQSCYIFSIICEGFESGKLVIVTSKIEEEIKLSIVALLKFFCGLLSF